MRVKFTLVLLCLIAVITLVMTHESACRTEPVVRVIFVEWKPDGESLVTHGVNGVTLKDSEIDSLKRQNLGGTLTVVGSIVHGKHSKEDQATQRIIIVMQHQLDHPVELRQPRTADVIFLQRKNRWEMLPPNVPTSNRLIKLEVNSEYKNQTMYWFQLPDGSKQGMSAFEW